MDFRRRDIFLKIEPLLSYSPLAPVVCSRRFGRDCMYNTGHEYGRISAGEILASTLDALVYREYVDPHFMIPSTGKIVPADVNEPVWNRRIPGFFTAGPNVYCGGCGVGEWFRARNRTVSRVAQCLP